jgi:hypothetical protein
MRPWKASRAWHTLVHVCQRWRSVVLASPVYLKLFLVCIYTNTSRMKDIDIWPSLPLLVWIRAYNFERYYLPAVLEQLDRVRCIVFDVTSFKAEQIRTAMLKPFPALTHLDVLSNGQQVLPDTFLGGSAPRLQYLRLFYISFPTLPKLLLSTSDLVQLHLLHMPTSGYISPDAMATSLSALTKLEALTIGFYYRQASLLPQSTLHPPQQTRAVLPSLTFLRFEGISEYLNVLLTMIDAPHLQHLSVKFFDRLILQIGQLPRFISYVGMPRSFDHAEVVYSHYSVQTRLHPRGAEDPHQCLELEIAEVGELSLKLQSMQKYNQLSFLLSSVESLDIFSSHDFPIWEVNMANTQWLELFQSFTAVRTLRISRHWQPFIVSALQELTEEMATAVLPALNNIYLEVYQPYGPEQQGLELFITARQYSGHPVAIQRLESLPMRWHFSNED